MKPIENRKHHYVPQLLLRNFASSGRTTLHAFDKSNSRRFQVAISDAAAERAFYTFENEEIIGCAEDMFTKIENNASDIIRGVVEKRSLAQLSTDEIATLGTFIVAQSVRSKNSRAIYKQIGDDLRYLATNEGSEEFKAWVGDYDPDLEKEHEIISLHGRIIDLLPSIIDKHTSLLSTGDDYPFLIGDSPVVRTNSLNRDPYRGTCGFGSPGVEIYLPLSPTLAIGFLCKTIAAHMEELIALQGRKAPDVAYEYLLALEYGRTIEQDRANVDFLNSLQVIGAERYVYSNLDNFNLAAEMVETNPESRTGLRLSSNLHR